MILWTRRRYVVVHVSRRRLDAGLDNRLHADVDNRCAGVRTDVAAVCDLRGLRDGARCRPPRPSRGTAGYQQRNLSIGSIISTIAAVSVVVVVVVVVVAVVVVITVVGPPLTPISVVAVVVVARR